MKGVLFVLFAVVAMAMARFNDPFCSVSGTGTANVTMAGTTYKNLGCTMVRVSDYALYTISKEEQGVTYPIGYILSRPDLSKSLFYITVKQECNEYPMSIGYSSYDTDGEVLLNGLERFPLKMPVGPGQEMTVATVTINGNEIVGESFNVDGVSFDIIYDYVNYSFENFDNDLFKFEPCSLDAPEDATTSTYCSNVPLPENFCSMKANGTATLKLNVPVAGEVTTSKVFSMIRVKNAVRYDLYDISEEDEELVYYASFILRPDLYYDRDVYDAFIFRPSEEEGEQGKCNSTNLPLLYADVEFDSVNSAKGDFNIYRGGGQIYELYVDKSSGKPVKEKYEFHDFEMQTYLIESVEFDYDLDNVDFDFVRSNPEDGAFSVDVDDDTCEPIKEDLPLSLSTIQCSPVEIHMPTTECAFEALVPGEGPDGKPTTFSVKVMNAEHGYASVTFQSPVGPITYMAVRCDHSNKLGQCLTVSGGWYGYDMDLMKMFGFSGVEFRGEPIDTNCSDKSDCKMYCNMDDIDNECFVFDSENRIATIYGELPMTYLETKPTLADFSLKLSDGTEVPAPTKDLCRQDSSSSSNKGGDSSSSNKGTSSSNKGTSSSSTNGEESSSSISSPSFYLLSLLAVAVASLLFAF